ncbi:MAG: MFS transporter [Chloroflexota bacterium]
MSKAREITYGYRWVIIGVLWSAYIVVFLHRLSIGPLGPFLKDQMGLTSTQVGSLMSAAAFGYMISAVPAGLGTDRIGVRWMLVIGEFLGGIFIACMFLTPSYTWALVIMALAGFGCGCLTPSTTKGVIEWFPVNERSTMMGIKQTAVNIGGIVSAATLPVVALSLGWRYGFLFLGILAMAIGIISFVLYKDPPKATTSTSEQAAMPASVGSLKELFKSRDIWLAYVFGFFFLAVEFGVIAHLVLYLKEALLFPVVAAGGLLAMTEAGGAVGKPLGGVISDRLFGSSRKKVLILWGSIACIMCLLITLFGAGLSWALYAVLIILGLTAIGFGGLHLTLVAELAGKELVGLATGVNVVVSMLGNMLGPILFGYIVDTTGSYQPAWLSMAVLAAISALVVLFVREERRRI